VWHYVDFNGDLLADKNFGIVLKPAIVIKGFREVEIGETVSPNKFASNHKWQSMMLIVFFAVGSLLISLWE
jgi:hypothetical protein